jgi:hypothetical protein
MTVTRSLARVPFEGPAPRALRSSIRFASLVVLAASLSSACNAERKQECDRFIDATKPLDKGVPTSDAVDSVSKQVSAMTFQDETLGIYAKNYLETLKVLSSTLKLKEEPSPPDGTDGVIKEKLKTARTQASDLQRYCAP